MLSLLVFIVGAVITEAGVIRQPNVGFGLNYHTTSSRVVRLALIKSHIIPPIGFGRLNHYSPAFTGTLLASPLVLNSAPTRHAAFATLPSIHRAPVPINLREIGPALKFNISPPIILSSGPIIPSVTSSHISPPVVFKAAPALGPASTITHISPPTVPASPSSNAATIEKYKIVHDVEEIHEAPQKSVSYSLSENDYQYLKRHKSEGQDSPYNPVPGLETASSPSEKQNNHHTHHSEGKDVPNKPSESNNLLKRSAATNTGNSFQGYSEPSFINAPEPVVTKHIYFHVPPPDFEEPKYIPISQSIPRKKTYNIVFIKVPAQQSNEAYLQQLLQSRQSQIEDKTLIYVLSKKQESPSPVVLLPQKTSSPEVFFVKYKTKPGDTTEISDEIIDESVLDNISPVLDQKR